jgi:hypothetical protein
MSTSQIPTNSVVEWYETPCITSGGVDDNAPRVRRIGRVILIRQGLARIQPANGFDAYSAITVAVERLTVIAEQAEAGWGRLA